MKRNSSDVKTVSVFYNSACPVCDAGISKQKKRMQEIAECSQEIRWNDVHENNELICELNNGPTLNFVRERLHIIDSQGQIQIGIDAFITLWKISPSEVWKARILEKPVIHSLATSFYNIFAFCLFRWNKFRGNW